MPRDAVSRTAHVGTVGTNGLNLLEISHECRAGQSHPKSAVRQAVVPFWYPGFAIQYKQRLNLVNI